VPRRVGNSTTRFLTCKSDMVYFQQTPWNWLCQAVGVAPLRGEAP
jgi:hypothetical protein